MPLRTSRERRESARISASDSLPAPGTSRSMTYCGMIASHRLVAGMIVRRCPGGRAAGSARQAGEGFAILLAGSGDDLRRQLRPRRLLVPVESLEIVAHELLVEARRAGAWPVGVGRPEARGIRRERLIDQGERAALIDYELELGVGNDDAAAEGMRRRELIERNGGVADPRCKRRADELLDLGEGDVLVVLPGGRLGCRSED